MLNVLLCYSMLMTMKHAGCFVAAESFLRRAIADRARRALTALRRGSRWPEKLAAAIG